ncbi:hypothetical protein SDC9_108683 [bioreactor metagenome]|uniref:Uncharacterized protein n=1 Tax=bioreactor metagenome TaxID=1076179 RepID=A0A645B8P5_9ZZZZ
MEEQCIRSRILQKNALVLHARKDDQPVRLVEPEIEPAFLQNRLRAGTVFNLRAVSLSRRNLASQHGCGNVVGNRFRQNAAACGNDIVMVAAVLRQGQRELNLRLGKRFGFKHHCFVWQNAIAKRRFVFVFFLQHGFYIPPVDGANQRVQRAEAAVRN